MKVAGMKRASLRNRLLLAGGLGLLLVTALASALLGHLFERAARDSLDAALEQDLLTVLAQAEVDAEGRVVLRQEPNEARFQRVFSGAYWQLSSADGAPLLQSRSLWDQSLTAPVAPGEGTASDIEGPLQQPLVYRLQFRPLCLDQRRHMPDEIGPERRHPLHLGAIKRRPRRVHETKELVPVRAGHHQHQVHCPGLVQLVARRFQRSHGGLARLADKCVLRLINDQRHRFSCAFM